MGKRKCTDAEDIRNLNIRASENQLKIGRKKLALAVRNCPFCVPPLLEKLAALGYDDERISKTEDMAKSFQTQALEMRRHKPKDEREAKLEEDTCTAGDGENISSRYWKLDGMSRALFMTRIVPAIDPRILSAVNLNANLDKSTDRAKEQLLLILEAGTGLPGDMSLTGELRYWGTFLEMVSEQSRLRGRRSLSRVFPPDLESWLYTVSSFDSESGVVKVEHTFSGSIAEFPVDRLPIFDQLSDLKVVNNHSERTAAIKSDMSEGPPYILANDLKDQHVSSPAPKGFGFTPQANRQKNEEPDSASIDTKGNIKPMSMAMPVEPPVGENNEAGDDSDMSEDEGDEEENKLAVNFITPPRKKTATCAAMGATPATKRTNSWPTRWRRPSRSAEVPSVCGRRWRTMKSSWGPPSMMITAQCHRRPSRATFRCYRCPYDDV